MIANLAVQITKHVEIHMNPLWKFGVCFHFLKPGLIKHVYVVSVNGA